MKEYRLSSSRKPAALRINYSKELNDQQLAAVTSGGGQALVLAGAGTGKTRTLTYRVAWLIEQGVSPSSILLLTFTNRAAREMLGRVHNLLSTDTGQLVGGTFHSVGFKILREFGWCLNYPKQFTVMDREDTTTLMQSCLAELALTTRQRKRLPRANVLARMYSMMVSQNRTLDQLLLSRYTYFVEVHDALEQIFERYARLKLELGVMDYDDLLSNWKRLFDEFEDVRKHHIERYEHVLVDEYQDTNRIQGELVDMCAVHHQNLMVVGDDCQSIYSFRGADFRNILDFPKRHEHCRVYKLEKNYRSTPQILDLSNTIITHNKLQYPKTLFSDIQDGERPWLVSCQNARSQAQFVADRILQLREDIDLSLNEVAVLYRAHSQALHLEVELARYGIPFIVRSGLRFVEQAHMKDVLSYLRLAHNPTDALSFQRITKQLQWIGAKTTQAIWRSVIESPNPIDVLTDRQPIKTMKKAARESWEHFALLARELFDPALQREPAVMIERVLTAGYEAYLEKSYPNAQQRKGELEELMNLAAQYDGLDSFLGEIALLQGVAGEDIVTGGEGDEWVVLSSIHRAKGLEWRVVFLVWLADGWFPIPSTLSSLEEVEEERRLFYVAATRAKDLLYMSYPNNHMSRDGCMIMVRPSPFVVELNGADTLYEMVRLVV